MFRDIMSTEVIVTQYALDNEFYTKTTLNDITLAVVFL